MDDPNNDPCYICDLCQSKMDMRQVIHHVVGIKHRHKYLVRPWFWIITLFNSVMSLSNTLLSLCLSIRHRSISVCLFLCLSSTLFVCVYVALSFFCVCLHMSLCKMTAERFTEIGFDWLWLYDVKRVWVVMPHKIWMYPVSLPDTLDFAVFVGIFVISWQHLSCDICWWCWVVIFFHKRWILRTIVWGKLHPHPPCQFLPNVFDFMSCSEVAL